MEYHAKEKTAKLPAGKRGNHILAKKTQDMQILKETVFICRDYHHAMKGHHDQMIEKR